MATKGGARLLDPHRRRVQAGKREELRSGRLQGRGVGRRPLQERIGGAIVSEGSPVQRQHAIGDGEAALEAVLGEHDGRLPLLVQTPQQADQLVRGDWVEL